MLEVWGLLYMREGNSPKFMGWQRAVHGERGEPSGRSNLVFDEMCDHAVSKQVGRSPEENCRRPESNGSSIILFY